ncbi:hypothetical protein [Streptomyces indiaensis]|nr:hypothetical protein [Streptomyces indiaensis]
MAVAETLGVHQYCAERRGDVGVCGLQEGTDAAAGAPVGGRRGRP